eukprot:SAG11_NODE_985_length_6288_cov_53.468972_6_plen_48_part_00
MKVFVLAAFAASASAEAPRYWPKFAGNRDVQLLDGQCVLFKSTLCVS